MSDRRIQIILFCLCFLFRAVPALFSVPTSYISDEVSAISAGALAAGWQWQDVVSNAGYYGFGFLILFAPLFRLHLNAVAIYKIMMLILALVDAAGAIVCWRLQYRFFPEISGRNRFLNSLLCFSLLFFSLPDFNVRNENILILLSWCLAYCLCMLVFRQHTRRAQAGILFILLFSQTVHSRAIILTIGVVAVHCIYFLIYRRKLFSLPFLAAAGAGTLVMRRVISLYMARIWTGSGVRNSSVSNVLARSASKLNLSLTYISCMLRIFFGQLYTAAAVSLGIFLLAAVALLLFIFRKRHIRRETAQSRVLFVLGVMFLGNIFLTMCGQSVTWSNGVYKGVLAGTYAYSYKAFTYLRYFGFNVPPMVLAGSIVCLTSRKIVRQAVPIVCFLSIALSVIWCMGIVPLIVTDNNYYFKLIPGWQRKALPTYMGWYATVVCSLAVIVLWLLLILQKRWRVVAAGTAVFLIMSAGNQFFSMTRSSQLIHMRLADASVDFLKEAEGIVPTDEIYVYDGRGKTDHQTFYIAQFLNYDRHVIPGLPENTQENEKLVFSNRNIQGYFEGSHWWVRLDGNEYVFFSSRDLADALKAGGYDVQKAVMPQKCAVAVFYNKNTKDHFYTAREDEIAVLTQADSAYRYIGTGWYAEQYLTPHTVPVYRFYDLVNQDHVYTSSEEERTEYLQNKAQYRAEGIAWYSEKEGEEIYCVFDARHNDHLYTTDRVEAEILLKENPANRRIDTGLYYSPDITK